MKEFIRDRILSGFLLLALLGLALNNDCIYKFATTIGEALTERWS